ncbi:hypothetical protein Bhyg_03158 [Pseudolycoriella hygida]|uniref:Uncharacterized protein n=1 Tax=Pseudolycoriella hygida TaxID=35572 RepID=A0A9Q0S8G9_9DIPT|nr:hypothetical protein Bhyg_03158 [Pseudolycoriella hygida]
MGNHLVHTSISANEVTLIATIVHIFSPLKLPSGVISSSRSFKNNLSKKLNATDVSLNAHSTPIELDEDNIDTLTLTVTDKEIAELNNGAAGISIKTAPQPIIFSNNKRARNSSAEGSNLSTSVVQPLRKIRKMMEPLKSEKAMERPVKHLVRLVPDIEDIFLFTNSHGKVLHASVMSELKKVKDPNIIFEFCDFERGRHKFVCPNETAKNWALNIVPSLSGL